jgi:cytidyltransferase-like protein
MVVVSGSFDDFRSRHVRFLHEASRLGELHLLLWSDRVAQALEGKEPRFPQEERRYLLQAVRYVSRLTLVTDLSEPDALPLSAETNPGIWVVEQADDNAGKRAFARRHGIDYRVLAPEEMRGFPWEDENGQDTASGPKVLATGCYDWLHSGHVRFFEEVSQLGALYVVVGHDDNIQLLKGGSHPMLSQEERRYMVGAMRYVHRALITSGKGWMDAEPEVARIRPDIYVVNEDGDRPEKRAFCAERGLRYVVLKRTPKDGLRKRQSTDLRGY